MKRAITILLLLIATATVSAQTYHPSKKWIRLGVDRDTLAYIIASPFDNWYITVGAGAQTFIGNEVEASARCNKLNWNGRIEIGKWVIPDVAISLRYSLMNVDGQTRYGLNPFVDWTGYTTHVDDLGRAVYPYQPFHVNAMTLMGFVTLDWTNFLRGYERGKRTWVHIYTPIGFGGSMLYGKQINPRAGEYQIGDFRRNFELCFATGIGANLFLRPWLSVGLSAEIFGSESTWDWSSYDNSRYAKNIFDLIPSLNLNVTYNILRDFNLYNSQDKTFEEVRDWGFETYGSHNELRNIHDRIADLNRQKDALQDLADDLDRDHADQLRRINDELARLQQELEDEKKKPGYRTPTNLLSELIQVNEALNLPATIIYFQLDKYDIDYNARKRLQAFAREMNALDDTLEFYLIGAADSLTGSIPHNKWLSEKRCGVTYDMLTRDFGVSGNQLVVVPLGGITEYEPQENNRMAMLILRTPVTEEIVDRWTKKRPQVQGRR